MKHTRLRPKDRKDAIVRAALPLAEAKGYDKITRDDVAAAAGVSGPVVNYHFGSMALFRAALIDWAVESESLRVVALALINNDLKLEKSDPLRARALSSLS